jgi:indolepyruvate ferredoxin oxidoreductase alpha subunit
MKGRKASFSGDIGCYTLGNAQPLDMVDTCLCMGAGITQAQGLALAEPDALRFAFIGDGTLFHTGLPGIVNAVYNGHDVIICVLDNATTAMTGGQPHPGMPRTLMGAPAKAVNAFEVVKAMGVDDITRVNAFDLNACKEAIEAAAKQRGVRVIFFEGPCINLAQKGAPCVVKDNCTGCGLCVKKLGCPAMAMQEKKLEIDETLCTGCGLCAQVCPFRAIGGAA